VKLNGKVVVGVVVGLVVVVVAVVVVVDVVLVQGHIPMIGPQLAKKSERSKALTLPS
jgi:hypothetical protein